MKHKYTDVYERSETGWAAYVAELPGLGVAARTRKHVSMLIREGIKFHLEGLRENEIKAKRLRARSCFYA
jgi:predicted RNase H-like HicB family nuclease